MVGGRISCLDTDCCMGRIRRICSVNMSQEHLQHWMLLKYDITKKFNSSKLSSSIDAEYLSPSKRIWLRFTYHEIVNEPPRFHNRVDLKTLSKSYFQGRRCLVCKDLHILQWSVTPYQTNSPADKVCPLSSTLPFFKLGLRLAGPDDEAFHSLVPPPPWVYLLQFRSRLLS